ncbi:copper homeostasis periplasmic binding protein CopC [Phenylobacterium sp.]|uniref:copper homeostasis periplasmic binding protein CopC n=1 Tax=Phenylobacterium sp. TaxID=1871053 RepID=UPI00122B20AA|nr:copper homeostasis periplasmic binding protein CopC [Phenylobacterium sp.]THD64724.1 MAG: copper homeostasis periplasmic binding protein CopC [Phenylobacterium sp.]
MRKTLLVLTAAAAALALAGQAAAHARLITGSPKAGATVAAPRELALHYSESIEPGASHVTVTGPSGAAVATGPLSLDAKDKRLVHVPFTAPPAHGAYKVNWHMKTEDGHETDGDFGFTVK